jgi:hypothetical protein
LLGLALVDLRPRYSYLALTLEEEIPIIIERPEIIGAFFPFLVRTLASETESAAQFVKGLLEPVRR